MSRPAAATAAHSRIARAAAPPARPVTTQPRTHGSTAPASAPPLASRTRAPGSTAHTHRATAAPPAPPLAAHPPIAPAPPTPPRATRPRAPRATPPGPGAPSRPAGHGEAGLTLVEVLIALALFALIGMAGFALLDTIARVQSRTDQRLERLGHLQRAMHIVAADFEQLTPGTLATPEGSVAWRRAPGLALSYHLAEGALRRRIGRPGAAPADQALVQGVAALAWRFHLPGRGWVAAWPPPGPGAVPQPDAIALEITLAEGPLTGTLSRTIRLAVP